MRAASDLGARPSPNLKGIGKAVPAKTRNAEKGTKRRADGTDAVVTADPAILITATSANEKNGHSDIPKVHIADGEAKGSTAASEGIAPKAKKMKCATATSAAANSGPPTANGASNPVPKAKAKDGSKTAPKGKEAKAAAKVAEEGKAGAEKVAVVSVEPTLKGGKKIPPAKNGKKRAAEEPSTKADGGDNGGGGAADASGNDAGDGCAPAATRRVSGAGQRKSAQRVKSYKETEERKDDEDEEMEDAEETLQVKNVKDAATEDQALKLTAPSSTVGTGDAFGVRSLSDFTLVDSEGRPEPLDRLSTVQGGLFITGTIELPGARAGTKSRAKGSVGASTTSAAPEDRCRVKSIGPIREWRMKYSAVVEPKLVLHTELAQYECGKSSPGYRKLLEPLLAQVELAGAVYRALCTEAGGRMDSSFEEVCCRVARTKVSKQYGGARFALKLNGRFLLEQLVAMAAASKPQLRADATAKDKGKAPADNGAAATCTYDNGPFAQGLKQALETEDHMPISKDALVMLMGRDAGGIRINADGGEEAGGAGRGGGSGGGGDAVVDDDYELACRLMAEEYAEHMNGGGRSAAGGRRGRSAGAGGSKEPYIQVREEEIADDYPAPKEYKGEEDQDEWDELILEDPELLGCGFHGADERESSRTLDQFAIYNADGFLTTLELVPMVAGLDANVSIFASGVLAEDTGDWGAAPAETGGVGTSNEQGQSQAGAEGTAAGSGSGASGAGGQRYFLTQIKEWFVECGPEGQVVINIRTDVSWYRLVRPQKRYAPWYRVVQRVANIAVEVLKWLDEQDRASRLSFPDIVSRLATLPPGHAAFISSKVDIVERFVVVHGQVILNLIGRHYKETIRRCGFAKTLRTRLTERRHRKLAVGGKRGFHKAHTAVVENPVKNRQVRQTKKSNPMPATATAQVRQVWSDYFNALDEIQQQQLLKKQQQEQQGKGTEMAGVSTAAGSGADGTIDVAGGAAAAAVSSGAAVAAVANTPPTVLRLPKIQSKTWTLTDSKSKDKATGRTFYSVAVFGNLRLTPGSVIRLGTQLCGDESSDDSSSDDDDDNDDDKVSDNEAGSGGGAAGGVREGGDGSDSTGANATTVAARRRWEVLTRGPFGLVQCIFTEDGASETPKLQIRRLVHGRDTMLADVAAPSELFLLDRTPMPAVPASRGGAGDATVLASINGTATPLVAPGDVKVLPLNGRTVAELLEAKMLSRSATHNTRLEGFKADVERIKEDAERVASGRPPVFVYRTVYCPLQGKFRELRIRDLDLGSYVAEAPTRPSWSYCPTAPASSKTVSRTVWAISSTSALRLLMRRTTLTVPSLRSRSRNPI
ncbi:hypothetical protein Vretimale_12977 [Volvox reticuliferus]|nr:hypothetical protein Vretimale_12977 [Volvox reticuliferus]